MRKRLPQRYHRLAQTGYVQLGRVTAGQRLRPSFIMIGASRAGTTTLFRALTDHPNVLRPTVNKGVRYFDLNYYRPRSWYYAHFPLRRLAERGGVPRITFEASGYYSFHPAAVPRMAAELPDVRVVMMLRDPVERAYSAWKHESARGFEWETFERALELEDERLIGEEARMLADPTYESFCHRHQSHRSRGEYATQIARVLEHFPAEQLHVVESERFFERPAAEYSRLLQFLGLPEDPKAAFAQHNARPSAPMAPEVERRLRQHYRPHDEHLADLLGHRPAWAEA